MREVNLTYLENDENRVDKYFDLFGFDSRSEFQSLIKDGNFFANGKKEKQNYKLRENDIIKIVFTEEQKPSTEGIEVPILFENENIIVLNKPPFIAVHGAKSYNGPTLVDWLLDRGYKLSDGEDETRLGVVHRLDADTSGVIIFAKNNEAHAILKRDFQEKNIEKHYFAISNGVSKSDEFTIDKPIARSKNPVKMGIVEGGRRAVSIVKKLDGNDFFTLFDVKIITGRTHQIRVHLASENLPVLGDKVYGMKRERINVSRQMLHAHSIEFLEPLTREKIKIEAPIFDDMKEALKKADLSLNKTTYL